MVKWGLGGDRLCGWDYAWRVEYVPPTHTMRRQHRGRVLARQPISEHFALELASLEQWEINTPCFTIAD